MDYYPLTDIEVITMRPQEELRMAWALWHMLSQLTEILWERYEDDFLELCIEMDRTSPQQFGHNGTANEHP
jgi:hypothetical protein